MSGTPQTPTAWNADNWSSLIRSGLKIVGTVLTTLGVLDASQGATFAGPMLDAVMTVIGGGVTLVGMFQSFWHHSP